MLNFNQLLLLTLLTNPLLIFGKLSDFRLCANKECSEPVALAKTLLSYNSPENGILSFPQNADAKIFSKSAGSRLDLWGVEINGKRGYVPKNFLHETKILIGKLDFLVKTELIDQTKKKEDNIPAQDNLVIKEAPSENLNKNEFNADGVTPSYEVFYGTTIYMPGSSPETTPMPTIPQSAPVKENNSNKNGAEATTPLPILRNKENIPPNIFAQNLNSTESTKEEQKNVEVKRKLSKSEESAPRSGNEQVETSTDASKNEQIVKPKAEVIDTEEEEKDDQEEDDEEDEDSNEDEQEDENIVVDYDDEVPPKEAETEKKFPDQHIADYNEINLKVKNNETNSVVETDKTETSSMEENKIPVLPTPLPNINKLELSKIDQNHVPTMEEPNLQYLKTPESNSASENLNINIDLHKNEDKISENLVVNEEENEATTKIEDTKQQEKINIPQNSGVNPQKNPDILQNIEEEKQKNEGAPLNPDVVKQKEKPPNLEQINYPDINKDDPISVEIKKEETIFLDVTKVEEEKPPLEIDISRNTIVDSPKLEEQFIPDQNSKEVSQNVSQVDVKVPRSDQKVPFIKEEVELTNKVPGNIETQLPNVSSELPELMYGSITTESPQNFEIPPPIFEEVTERVNVETELPIYQPLTDESKGKIKEIDSENDSETTEEPGIFSGMFSWMSSPEHEVETTTEKIDEKKLLEDALLLDKIAEENKMADKDNKMDDINKMEGENGKLYEIIDQKLELTSSKNIESESVNAQLFDKHTHEKRFEKYMSNEGIPKQTGTNEESCSQSENPSECLGKMGVDEIFSDQMTSTNEDINFQKGEQDEWSMFDIGESGVNIFLYLSLTAVTLLLFSLGHYYIEKRRIDNKLVSNINQLEKKLLVISKESQLLQEELSVTKEKLSSVQDSSSGSNEIVSTLKEELEEARITRTELEDQISTLEKELENATEAGLELNKMLADFLASQSGNENIMENVEHLQKQLFEQQSTINTINGTLNIRNLENEKLQSEIMKANEKIEQLQSELDKMVVNLLSVQEAKSKNEAEFEEQIKQQKDELENKIHVLKSQLDEIKQDNVTFKQKCDELKRALELKNNEYQVLKDSMKEVSTNKESLAALLDVSKVKAEVQQLREEKHGLTQKLGAENESKQVAEKQIQVIMQELKILKDKLEEADKEKVEAQTRLDVLSTYFKEKEAQLQKEIAEHESMWMQKQGEATSTVERIKWIQEELQNYKSQNELLKKEILDQEVGMKSQISMLEKKSHDNWVLARQAERKLEESKQEASQLRNRLTIVEKNLSNASLDESKLQSRLMQPIEANGDTAVSPMHMGSIDNPGSPPLLYPHRDHMTTSPPLPGLPFMPPPPPGVPFMPPPPGVPPFMPPPLFPGDHRPPPLGRMSSPPMHGRYSPDSRTYSPYDRDDSPPPSPGYPDSDYRRGRSPPRNYSPYRDYRDRPPPQRNMKNRNHKVSSSGSGNSNESLDNNGRHSRV